VLGALALFAPLLAGAPMSNEKTPSATRLPGQSPGEASTGAATFIRDPGVGCGREKQGKGFRLRGDCPGNHSAPPPLNGRGSSAAAALL